MELAIIGCGNIGKAVALFVDKDKTGNIRLGGLFDIEPHKAKDLAGLLKNKPAIFRCPEDLYKNKDIDYVLEAASQEAVKLYGKKALESGKNMIIMSVGAFTDSALFQEMRQTADRKGLKIHIPSGAVAGIDGLKSAKFGGIEEVTLTTRKNPKSLGIDAKEETILYEGPAREGIKRFPKNVNVASTISLAGVGLDKTRLKLIADPKTDKNIHLLNVKGGFGEFSVKIENVPSPENPRTSHLAVISAIATLKEIAEPVQIGT